MADDLTALQRLKQYLATDDAPGGTWRLPVTITIQAAVTLRPQSKTIPPNRAAELLYRSDDVFDGIINQLATITSRPIAIDPNSISGNVVKRQITLRNG